MYQKVAEQGLHIMIIELEQGKMLKKPLNCFKKLPNKDTSAQNELDYGIVGKIYKAVIDSKLYGSS